MSLENFSRVVYIITFSILLVMIPIRVGLYNPDFHTFINSIDGGQLTPYHFFAKDEKVVDFLKGKASVISEPDITLSEMNHMREVKQVAGFGKLIFDAFFIMNLFSIIYLGRRALLRYKDLLISGIVAAAIIVVKAPLFYFLFDSFFSTFHAMLFSAPYSFSKDSFLITMYPQKFFIYYTLISFAVTLFLSGLLILFGYIKHTKSKHKKKDHKKPKPKKKRIKYKH